jgi:hypothetical protein
MRKIKNYPNKRELDSLWRNKALASVTSFQFRENLDNTYVKRIASKFSGKQIQNLIFCLNERVKRTRKTNKEQAEEYYLVIHALIASLALKNYVNVKTIFDDLQTHDPWLASYIISAKKHCIVLEKPELYAEIYPDSLSRLPQTI